MTKEPRKTESDEDLETLLQYVKRTRGFDFTGYKRPTLERRIAKRVQASGVADLSAYLDYLEVHPEEFARLFDTILINVTSFFRDRPTWNYLMTDVIPQMIEAKSPGDPIRVWSAGCATGEEAYTLVMALAEVMGIEQFRERVKIYATDADENALSHARLAVYDASALDDLEPELREKYFERVNGRFAFRKDLRRLVIFGRHDLVQDAPISRIDLLTCRNTLMYFNAETQARILERFNFALTENGFLFLGRAETMMAHASLFTPVDLRRRVSRKAPGSSLRERVVPVSIPGSHRDAGITDPHETLRKAAFELGKEAKLVIDEGGTVVLANERARALLDIRPADIGRPLQDLKISYRPVELRSLIDEAYSTRRVVVSRNNDWTNPDGDRRWIDVNVIPLLSPVGQPIGGMVTFQDVTISKKLQLDLEVTNHALEAAYEELQSTNEELETTNEELQSTVEELETTNEELQSANEELETMNEELQSANEELHGMNDEIQTRGDEQNSANSLLTSVLGGISGGVAVADRDLRVVEWNRQAAELWGVRRDEVMGRSLFELDIGLPLNRVKPVLLSVMHQRTKAEVLELRAVNRRGKTFTCNVTITPLIGDGDEARGIILVMENSGGTAGKGNGVGGEEKPSNGKKKQPGRADI